MPTAPPAIVATATIPATPVVPIATVVAAPSPPDGGTASAEAAAAPAALVRFQVLPDQSKAAFRVREQLARLQAPSDAVGSTGKVDGQIVIAEDGSLPPGQSRVTVDLNDLRTDDQLRDGFIKRTTLDTQRYPTAEFVPTAVEGLPAPLPEAGEYTFRLAGQMTLHGVQKDLTWDVTARREPGQVTGTATTHFSFETFGMQPPRAAVVLSVVDDIALEVTLVANQVT